MVVVYRWLLAESVTQKPHMRRNHVELLGIEPGQWRFDAVETGALTMPANADIDPI
jgi:hypothetical protein